MANITRCTSCGAEYDSSAFAPGYSFDCTSCGTNVVVSAAPAMPRPAAAAPRHDPYAGQRTPYGHQQPPAQSAKLNGMSLAGFILSLVGCPPLGLILSIIGRKQSLRTGDTTGAGLALAGIIIGGIFSVITLIYIVVFVAVIGSSARF